MIYSSFSFDTYNEPLLSSFLPNFLNSASSILVMYSLQLSEIYVVVVYLYHKVYTNIYMKIYKKLIYNQIFTYIYFIYKSRMVS